MGLFSKSKNRQEQQPSPTQGGVQKKGISYLGKNLRITGTITGDDNVQLFGSHRGDVRLKGELLIAEAAHIDGNVKAGSIEVGGDAEGQLEADAVLRIQPTGRIKGNIVTSVINVQEGALFNGEIKMHNS
jgi:cytoskeletal protein CcmA (bactofilin family)